MHRLVHLGVLHHRAEELRRDRPDGGARQLVPADRHLHVEVPVGAEMPHEVLGLRDHLSGDATMFIRSSANHCPLFLLAHKADHSPVCRRARGPSASGRATPTTYSLAWTLKSKTRRKSRST